MAKLLSPSRCCGTRRRRAPGTPGKVLQATFLLSAGGGIVDTGGPADAYTGHGQFLLFIRAWFETSRV